MISALLRKSYNHCLVQCEEMLIAASDSGAVSKCIPEISGWSVGHHLQHLVTVNDLIVQRIISCIEGTAPADTPPMDYRARIVFLLGRIPRRKVRAPRIVLPKEERIPFLETDLREVRDRLELLRPRLPEIRKSRTRTPHPILGGFTAAQWINYISIHNEHHLRIVREILDC